MIERLKKAEEEAAILRKQLQDMQQKNQDSLADKPAVRKIDSADLQREVPWSTNTRSKENWLAESAVAEVMTGGGPSEAAATAGLSADEEATVRRRVLIGGAITAVTIALSLVPDKALNPKPSKPLFFYLVPLVRAQTLLTETRVAIDNAEWAAVQGAVRSIKGSPTLARENLDNAAAFLEDGKTYERAKQLESEFLEYLEAVDYSKYFDSLEKAPPKGGRAEAEFVKFSGQACDLALERLASFLSLMDADQMEAARNQAR